ncbi:hypothetical protein CDIK_1563 [Cucumispora dikerogammari]|nr:hypothetical protein CDIK_1563 [Cucumispora dikerogammari]
MSNKNTTEILLIQSINWKETKLSTIFTLIKYTLTIPDNLLSINLYSKEDRTPFDIKTPTTEKPKIIGVAIFRNSESALEVYNKLNNANMNRLIIDLAFIKPELLKDLMEVDFCNREDLFEIGEDRADEFLEVNCLSEQEIAFVLKGYEMKEEGPETEKEYSNTKEEDYLAGEKDTDVNISESKKEKLRNIQAVAYEVSNSSKKKNKQDKKFIPNLKDERFEKFFTSTDFLIDKSSHFYTNNKMMDLFLEEKNRRDEDN